MKIEEKSCYPITPGHLKTGSTFIYGPRVPSSFGTAGVFEIPGCGWCIAQVGPSHKARAGALSTGRGGVIDMAGPMGKKKAVSLIACLYVAFDWCSLGLCDAACLFTEFAIPNA